MKHLLNTLSTEEKNRIREQHDGGMSIDTSKFKKLTESKLGDSKPLINEQEEVVDQPTDDLGKKLSEFSGQLRKLYPGIEPGPSSNIAKELMGLEYDLTNKTYIVKVTDMNERVKKYERERVKRGLTQLPSGDMISLILTLK